MPIADNSQYRDLLRQGLDQLGIAATDAQQHKLLAYLDLLAKWGKAWNLTAILEPRQMIIQHLLDSLSILPLLPSGSILDVGSGAGLPGIPLAIMLPATPVTLLDSVSRKTRFLRQVELELALENVQVETARVETLQPAVPFDVIVCRAFAKTQEIIAKTRHLCKKDAIIVAMKGPQVSEELELIQQTGVFCQVESVRVPFLGAERNVILIHLNKA